MYLWQQQNGWTRTAIATPIAIGRDVDGRVACGPPGFAPSAATVVPFVESGKRGAVLVSSGARVDVTVNGYPPLDVVLLEDRDEIGVAGARFFFAAYDQPAPAPMPVDTGETRCARCTRLLDAGEKVVRCPFCGAPHHAVGPDHAVAPACWDYDPLCGACDRQRAACAWTPEDDEAECAGR